MMTFKQEQRLKRALPDFYEYGQARFMGDDIEVEAGRNGTQKTIRYGQLYKGTFIVFPNSVIANVLTNVYLQTSPDLWEFVDESD